MSILLPNIGLTRIDDLTQAWLGGGTPTLDGQVSNHTELMAAATDPANAGKSFYMRDGNYGDVSFSVTTRPTSLITFITYPGEQAVMNSLKFDSCTNLRFDGNAVNTIREAIVRKTPSGLPSGSYGLWIKGNGAYTAPSSGNNATCLEFIRGGAQWTEGIQIANFRIGDVPSADWTQWRWQHGVIIHSSTRDLLLEDGEIAYLGNDEVSGDFTSGGFGVAWQFGTGEDADAGNYTFRRLHVHHTANDAFQHAAGAPPPALTLLDTCMIDNVVFSGANHSDCLQIVGSAQEVLVVDTVYDTWSQFLLQGSFPTQPRTFRNVLFRDQYDPGPTHSGGGFDVGKDDEPAPVKSYVLDSVTFNNELIRTDAPGGSAATSNLVLKNSIYLGFFTTSGVDFTKLWSNPGTANIRSLAGLPGLSSDVVSTPTFNGDGECTNHTQGWRKPTGFPWALS